MLPSSRGIHTHRSLVTTAHRLCDALLILVALLAAVRYSAIKADSDFRWDEPLTLAVAAAILGFYLWGEITGLYRSWRSVSIDREVGCVGVTWAATLVTLMILEFFTGYSERFERALLVAWTCFAPIMVAGGRVAFRGVQRVLRARGYNTRRFAIVGVNELAFQLAHNIEGSPDMGLVLAGFYDDRPADRTPEVPESVGRRVGTISELVEHARKGEVDLIYLTFPMRAEERIRGVLAALGDTTASVYLVPDFFVFELLHSRWTSIGGLPAVSVYENPFYGVDGMLKRAADLALASVALFFLSIPMAMIALLVRCTSAGPVFFRQKRYGLDGRPIRVWKFRTMRVCEGGDSAKQATRGDPRVTPVGAILRSTSLDELPQLFNVIEGTMSLVGPRPHPTALDESFRRRIAGYMLRNKVKPGITGLAQVNGYRGETETLDKMEGRIRFDHEYIRSWSLLLDLQIIAKTFLVVFSRKNAY